MSSRQENMTWWGLLSQISNSGGSTIKDQQVIPAITNKVKTPLKIQDIKLQTHDNLSYVLTTILYMCCPASALKINHGDIRTTIHSLLRLIHQSWRHLYRTIHSLVRLVQLHPCRLNCRADTVVHIILYISCFQH